VLILSKILIVISVLGLLRCSERFRRMSRELDEQAFTVLRRLIHATEDSGYPSNLIPLLMLLTALWFMLSTYVTTAGVR
jgi:hypothetical protein